MLAIQLFTVYTKTMQCVYVYIHAYAFMRNVFVGLLFMQITGLCVASRGKKGPSVVMYSRTNT